MSEQENIIRVKHSLMTFLELFDNVINIIDENKEKPDYDVIKQLISKMCNIKDAPIEDFCRIFNVIKEVGKNNPDDITDYAISNLNKILKDV